MIYFITIPHNMETMNNQEYRERFDVLLIQGGFYLLSTKLQDKTLEIIEESSLKLISKIHKQLEITVTPEIESHCREMILLGILDRNLDHIESLEEKSNDSIWN